MEENIIFEEIWKPIKPLSGLEHLPISLMKHWGNIDFEKQIKRLMRFLCLLLLSLRNLNFLEI